MLGARSPACCAASLLLGTVVVAGRFSSYNGTPLGTPPA